MGEFESLSHSKWECKYHVVFIPKFRRKVLYGELGKHLWEVFRKLAEHRDSRVEEGHLLPDHVHMMLSIPPKYPVSQVVGYIKGKSAIHLARVYGERHRGFIGQHFWARGCFVSTVGRDETVIRDYIKNQEKEDQRLDQLNLWRRLATLRWPDKLGTRQRPHPPLRAAHISKAPGFAWGLLLLATTGAGPGRSNLCYGWACRAR